MPMIPNPAFDQATADGTKSIGASAAAVVVARPGRCKLMVKNTHASQVLYLGKDNTVSNTVFNWKLAAGESVDLGAYTGAVWGYGSGAATTCVFFEGYTAR